MDFILAVAQNDLEKTRALLQSVDVNHPIPWNAKDTYSPIIPPEIMSQPDLLQKLQSDQEYLSRPLNIAVLAGHTDMVRLLLSAGADINLKDGRGRTALICAIYGLDLDATNINTSNLDLISQTHETHLDVMKNVLLSHPNLYASTLDSPQYEIKGITPLCLASYLGKAEIIQLLLDDGRVNVDGTDSKNATALMYAARDGNLPIVKMLLSYNASPDITDNHGWSAIQYAERNPKIVQLCEEALRCRRPDHIIPFATHTKYPISYTKLSSLIATLPTYPSSLSHLQFDTSKDIDLLDPNSAPLIQIIQSAFLQSIRTHDHHALRTLLLWSPPLRKEEWSASGPLLVNYHDPKTGMTALHHAVRARPLPSIDTIIMLYHAGADINAQTYYGRTALHHIARFGVDKDGKSWGIQKSGKAATGEGKKERRKNSSPSPMTSPTLEVRPMDYSEELTLGLDPKRTHRLSIQSAISSRSSASENAVRGSMAETNDVLTKKILNGSTVPQHLANCTSLLLRLGALVNIADPTGNTPLHFAAEFGAVPEVLEVLMVEGYADLSLKNKKGLTPLDVCKSDDIRKRLLALEQDRKSNQRVVSLTGGSAAHEHRISLTRSISVLTTNTSRGNNLKPEPCSVSQIAPVNTVRSQKSDALIEIDDEFEKVLQAFFSYQTTFTDSIEIALGYITDTILGNSRSVEASDQGVMGQLENKIGQLRYELREAHEMFDQTDQRAERVMFYYREELEQVEQIHQADWELSELQQDKIEKLFDVFERIDGRFCQLELDQDEWITQIERVRKLAVRRLDQFHQSSGSTSESLDIAISEILQSLIILDTVPIDPVLYSREDRSRLCQDLATTVENVINMIKSKPPLERLRKALKEIEERWEKVHALLTKPPENIPTQSEDTSLPVPSIKPPSYWQRQLITARTYSQKASEKSLNQMELSFEILASNLHEIEKDLSDIQSQTEQVLESKKKMYDLCLLLENELGSINEEDSEVQELDVSNPSSLVATKRPCEAVRAELQEVMTVTQGLFDRQAELDKEREQLLKEHAEVEKKLGEAREQLGQVRPPLLLQGLLERLETDELPYIRVEKDWKEDAQLVTEILEDEDDESSSGELSQANAATFQLDRCTSKLSVQCLITRLDASLYCLKVLATHHISRSRQLLLEVQAALSQASGELDATRHQMQGLYDDAADVARQVFALKTELETIVRHRKEEIVKVWEVVDEVSEGIDASLMQPNAPRPQSQDKKEKTEDNDRHQWIIREIEQLKNVHDNLQEAIEELKREQNEIGQHLRQFAAALIEPQVDKLVGQTDGSLLTMSDRLVSLMDHVRDRDLGLSSTK
ncbi:hypothetical protein EC973_001925 [Apophysomyces ossiformis]|uniref:Uncharacterized protein n=1 Tax=Apophysomyces ossiformis TaxID=679940 RepID=A0A8H7BYC4_9FUNG|nr:hypothetical protein EC973_001925 [Apophysomyces ossiformis]